ncbi:DNA-binding protein RHL1-like isoform X4 [Lycium barbarum]|uniref:DNA-binding protein RHL1-like isoform X4 n=1 Tax=Lycium barbarum TaxID=112863 RepID=UPI00293E4E79|nr:DNA-binding protein RHL1-like isoform X4 [Lycium barbarum]
MIVFSDAWWIGWKDENPEEARLEFPKELNVQQEKLECDFKGGAGATCVQKRSISECGVKHMEQQSPEHEQEENFAESQNDSKEVIELTSSRRAARAAGKKFKKFMFSNSVLQNHLPGMTWLTMWRSLCCCLY